jgi:16S rRNA (cytidine1402-2'-O)-methyltransferase
VVKTPASSTPLYGKWPGSATGHAKTAPAAGPIARDAFRLPYTGRMPGLLYVVATPIGNLEDITYRAVRVLGEADLIACEDTRQTRKLLDHYGIQRPAISYHEHNETERSEDLVSRLLAGEVIALVSDAGTPLVSDPGYRLVKAAIDAGIPVQTIPGPSATLAALAASGLPTDAFHFDGFLPPKKGQRAKALEALADEHATLIFYEAPHRILETLEAVEAVLGDRPVVVARELTKIHEEFLRGTAAEIRAQLAARDTVKGEITLLIGKALAPPPDNTPLDEAVDALVRSGTPRMDAIKQVARRRGLSKREVYDQLLGK